MDDKVQSQTWEDFTKESKNNFENLAKCTNFWFFVYEKKMVVQKYANKYIEAILKVGEDFY